MGRNEQGRPATGEGVGAQRTSANYGFGQRGTVNAASKSTRPRKNPLPTDLDAGGRLASWSTGTPDAPSVAPAKNAGAPNLGPVPRGYVHDEPSYTPSVRRMRADRLTTRKVD